MEKTLQVELTPSIQRILDHADSLMADMKHRKLSKDEVAVIGIANKLYSKPATNAGKRQNRQKKQKS